MKTFPNLFMGARGQYKSGMLGRWVEQCELQGWKTIPCQKLAQGDRECKELPDWLRLALGMAPRSVDRFKAGHNLPPVVVKELVKMVRKVTCGGERLTCGSLSVKTIQEEANRLLETYHMMHRKRKRRRGAATSP